jgi:glucose-6-phosphate-specific signal transduction histidine kinase
MEKQVQGKYRGAKPDSLGWPHEFDPLINFGLVFVSVLPVFLGYYHLGWRGAFLTFPVSAVMYFAAKLCASLLFVFFYHALLFDAVAYVSTCLLLSMLVFAAHRKSSNSSALRDAQRSLRLICDPQISQLM